MDHSVQNKSTDIYSEKTENGVIISLLTNNVRSYIHEIKFKTHHKHRRKKHCFLCRSKSNSLLIILGVYITIFSIASIILIVSVLKLQNLNENVKINSNFNIAEDVYSPNHLLLTKQIDKVFYKRLFKEFMWPFKSSTFNCSKLSNVKRFNYLTSGWTKNVFSFELNSKHYAIKTVNLNGVDMKNCMEKHDSRLCFEKASSKMYKEYILSRELTHTNIIKVFAWCVSGNSLSSDVAVITELCSPIDLISLLRMTFQQRLKVMVDLSRLLAYLADSPIGSIAINDFQRQQFVLCGNILKLTDLDDLSIEEPKCKSHRQCSHTHLVQDLKITESHTSDQILHCINNICSGYNEKLNIINAYKHFVNLFLNISTPIKLKPDVESLFDIYVSTWNAKKVLEETEKLYMKYENLNNK